MTHPDHAGWAKFPAIKGADDEFTEDSGAAHLAVGTLFEDSGVPHQYSVDGPEMRILCESRRLLVAVFGQSSATGHGKHGLIPERIIGLRDFAEASGLTLCLVFVESGAHVCYVVWPGDGEPPFAAVSLDPANRRQGWECKHMWKYALDVSGMGPSREGKRPRGRLTVDVMADPQRSPEARDKLFS